MIAFLRWAGSIVAGTFNGLVKFALAVVVVFGIFALIGMTRGDGLPGNMVLSLDLRKPLADSAPSDFTLGARPVTVMGLVLALDAAERDNRVKGVFLRLGNADLPIAQAEEIGSALKRFRAAGKFVIAHSQGFEASGLGDYLAATAANQIWMQPKSTFGAAGEGGGELFLRGFLDKIQAVPQIAKRAEYKSAADMFMESGMTGPDREQVTALMQSWYNTAVDGAAADRKLTPKALAAAFEASPQFAENAKKAGLIDKIGYDDDAYDAAIAQAGAGAKSIPLAQYMRVKQTASHDVAGPHIALIEASGDIVEGSAGGGMFGGNSVIAGDDMARAIRQATDDKDIKAIILRVDSPGGSVTASDQILDAVKKAQKAGKPVVVSMGRVAASGGYYISLSADKIVAEPGTITGSIGVLTGKVAIGKSLGMIGVATDQVGVGKNALMNSDVTPYTPEQWALVNSEADAIYADFMNKVAAGRRLPLNKVQQIARGRVWSGADAQAQGLVDKLGGFWTAAEIAKKLAGIPAGDRVAFELYPKRKGFFEAMDEFFGGSSEIARAVQSFTLLMDAPIVREAVTAVRSAPQAAIELRATNLPQ
ncbi:MAG: signal peptide peptidase SppA [Alphaproteobacteria bacterium]|nr:signal peptide peptidase SppA [Alphaproteobacteria bacterium]MDE1985710.1 signal peptide peptidase SppA [Alphaproteobacteria bacterium]MDE2163441.1 signal peptide peptidase SppA [Alphaproteobacteria bacterium]MDE2500883.1 signal peptide peptidase SppA [Alphaproteobacteria bacterium]